MKERKLTKQAYMAVLFICLIAVGVFLISIVWNAVRVKKVSFSDYQQIENVEFSLGEISNTGSVIQIPDAWIFEPGKTVGAFNVHLALYCENTELLYQLPSQYVKREDVAAEYNDEGYDYGRSGVYAICILKLIGYNPGYNYDIFFLIDSDGQKSYVDTGVTLG